MRRPHVASAGSFRKRLRKKQIQRRPRSTNAKAAALPSNELETAAREPMRCIFGAVRVGALLGRVRLHLQTDRFLAVHRGDELWEQACREAGLGLAAIVAGMQEAALSAWLGQTVIPSPPQAGEGSAVAVHASRTADSSSFAKGSLLGMTIRATRGTESPVMPSRGAQ
jgi:hypothetical protein